MSEPKRTGSSARVVDYLMWAVAPLCLALVVACALGAWKGLHAWAHSVQPSICDEQGKGGVTHHGGRGTRL